MRQKKKPSSEQHEKFLKGIRKKKTLVTCLRVLLLVFLPDLFSDEPTREQEKTSEKPQKKLQKRRLKKRDG